MDMVSKKTRRAFREYMVSWVLRQIEEVFDDHDIKKKDLPNELLPSGARRSFVECYYASIDWSNPTDVRKILNVYEEILAEIEEEGKKFYLELLEKDGYYYENGKIIEKLSQKDLIKTIHDNPLALEHLNIYIDRINSSVDSDLALAIGSMKELVEAVLKTILTKNNIDFDEYDNIPKLLKKAQKTLGLDPNEVGESKKGKEIIKKILGSLGQIVIGTSELRNLYGTGHGRSRGNKGLYPRHARLVIGAGTVLCNFLIETHDKKNIKS